MGSSTKHTVHKRRVFYIPGYDPFHPRRYRELYRAQSSEQAEISGYSITQSAKQTGGAYGWHVNAQIEGQDIQADIDVLVWSDIVRDSMAASIPATYGQLLRTAWVYVRTGALFRLMRLRKGPVIAALYPVGMLLLQAALAGMAAWLAFVGITWAFGFLSTASVAGIPLLHQVAGLGAGAVAFMRVLRWFKSKDGKFFAYYLMHDYAFGAQTLGANPAALETRMAEFGDQIAAALTQPYDEVLIVGHSSGAHLAVSILADVIRAGKVPQDCSALGFLSLGQVVPMVSFLPRAERLRGDLQFLSTRNELAWIDVTAPGDGCAFALCDPVAVSGVAPVGKRWPLVFSAAFTQSLSAERWKSLRWRFFRLHFQYLCAFDRPRDYDYFQITAGPISLADRYEGRPPSKSRIDRAVNGHRSVPSDRRAA